MVRCCLMCRAVLFIVTYDVILILAVNLLLVIKVVIDLSNLGSILSKLIHSLSSRLMKDLSRHNLFS